MLRVRRRLRVWATACLVWQAVSLSAIVPRMCCAAHQPPASTVSTGDEIPCPMHGGSQNAPPTREQCSLTSACNGPIAVLSALLSNQGIVSEPITVAPDPIAEPAIASAPARLVRQLAAPDPPPPRA
jgi:hypothetical protein